MSGVTYLFAPIQYTHDIAAAERLNVGVVVHAPSAGYIRFAFDHRWGRLAGAFGSFDHAQYTLVRRQLQRAAEALQKRLAVDAQRLDLTTDAPAAEHLGRLLRRVWPDEGLAYCFGPTGAGACPVDGLDAVADALLHRLVVSQGPATGRARRTPEQVWAGFQQRLERRGVTPLLHRHRFQAEGGFSFEFEHTFENSCWHVLEPLSFDYADPDSIREVVLQWLGRGTELRDVPESLDVHFLVGRPTSRELLRPYEQAKDRLRNRLAVPCDIHEDGEEEAFAARMASVALA
jgi:hypothetical protein